jgi:uncharacterized membrane protein
MKPTFNVLRTTLAGGILFLVVILSKAVIIAHDLVHPLAEHIPFHSILGLRTPVFMAISLIIIFCFLAGCFARTQLAGRMTIGLERTVLLNLPGYELFKGIGESLLGVEPGSGYETVLARMEDAWPFGFLVERLDNNMVAVFLADAPNPHSGAVYFMSADRIIPTSIPPFSAMRCLK